MTEENKQVNNIEDNPQQCGLSLDEIIANGGRGNLRDAYVPDIKKLWEESHRPYNKSEAWLIATYYDMIFAEGVFCTKDIESGYACLQLLMEDKRLFLEREHLKWYYTSTQMKQEYDETLEAHPEYVYLTIEEMGKENFKSLEEEKDD